MRRSLRAGASAMEFVFVMPLMVIMVFGIIEFSFFITHFHHLQRAARDGARVGSITLEGADPDGEIIKQAAEDQVLDVLFANGIDCGNTHDCRISTEWEELFADGTRWIVVEVEVPYQALTGVFPDLSDRARARFSAATQQQMPIEIP